MLKRLEIDPEFKNLIPPLSPDEYKQLEENLIAEGCRDKLVVWEDVIIDGHNRYAICQKHEIPFETKEMYWDERNEAIEWIIRNQFGRRNLPSYVRAELGIKLGVVIAEMAKANQAAGGGDKRAGLPILAKAVKPIHTRDEMAKIAGVSNGTMSKVIVIDKKGTPEQKEALRSGEKKINRIYKDIKEAESGTKVCSKCGIEKPISEYYNDGDGRRRTYCKECHNSNKPQKNAKGETYKTNPELASISESDIIGDLYDVNRIIDYTVDDLNESIGSVIDRFCRQAKDDLVAHKELLKDDGNIKKITANLMRAVEAVNEMIGDITNA